MNVDFAKLQIFYYLTIFKNINQVIERLDVSASTIKFSINQLEKKHNLKLFQRDGKVKITKYRLTKEGLNLFEKIKSFFKNFPYEKEEHLFENLNIENKKIIINSTLGIMKFLFPDLILNFDKDLFDLIEINQYKSNQFISDLTEPDQVLSNIVITNQNFSNTGFHSEKLYVIEFSFFGESNFLKKLDFSSQDNLMNTPIYLYSNYELIKIGAEKLKGFNIKYVENYDYLISILDTGKGIVFLPNLCKNFLKNKILKVFDHIGYEEKIFLNCVKKELTNENVIKIINHIKTHVIK